MISLTDYEDEWAAEREALAPRMALAVAMAGVDASRRCAASTHEKALAEQFGVAHAIALDDGADTLIYALRALDVGAGDEVIAPANGSIASAAAINHLGATLVLADVGPDGTLDPDAAAAALTPAAKAVIASHVGGRITDMNGLNQIAQRFGLKVVEDASQAAGALRLGQPPGGLGDVGCFSAYPLKNHNAAVQGGFVTTDDPEIATSIRRLRDEGAAGRDTPTAPRFASRIETVQALTLKYRLARLEDVVARRNAHAALYLSLLPPEMTRHLTPKAYARDAYSQFVIHCDERDALQAHLAENGVDSKPHDHPPIHLHRAARCFALRHGPLPNAERQARRALSLPIHQGLSEAEIRDVASLVNGFHYSVSRRRSAA